MGNLSKSDDFIKEFENLSRDEQMGVIKKLFPKICQVVMEDKSILQNMTPECMKMMKGMDFPMKEMMTKMMGTME